MKTEVNIRDAEEEKTDQDAALRSKELASMKALTFRHWEEITGVGICSGNSYVVSQKGIYPEQYSDDDLRLLTPEERKILLEMADRDPLIFPCAPSHLLSFVDEDQAMCFEVPDAFREEVDRLGAELRASEELGQEVLCDQQISNPSASDDGVDRVALTKFHAQLVASGSKSPTETTAKEFRISDGYVRRIVREEKSSKKSVLTSTIRQLNIER
jgi:hypothetical protein